MNLPRYRTATVIVVGLEMPPAEKVTVRLPMLVPQVALH
jgi:hypothetical protein